MKADKKRKLCYSGFVLAFFLIAGFLPGCSEEEPQEQPEEPVMPGVHYLSSEEANTLIQENTDNSDFVILDVRAASSYEEGHIQGAININVNLSTFRDRVSELDRDRTYLVYCLMGVTSRTAIETMLELGFKNIYYLENGLNEWTEAGLPVVQ